MDAGGVPLLEREVELERLGELLDLAAAGEGRVALVEGEAGIGKTALLAEHARLAAGRRFRVLTAQGGDLERDFTWGVVRQLYEPPLHDLPEAGRRRLLSGAAALAAPLLGISLADAVDGAPTLDATFAVNHGLYWLTAGLAERDPLVLVVDDAHWADSATLLFLNYLGRRTDGLRVLVVVGLRPAEPGAAAARPGPRQ